MTFDHPEHIKTENSPSSNLVLMPLPTDGLRKPRCGNQKQHNEGRWTDAEHALFLDGLRRYGRQWFNVGKVVKTRSVTQIRTHAQKFFAKQQKEVGNLLQHATRTPRKRRATEPAVSPVTKHHTVMDAVHHDFVLPLQPRNVLFDAGVLQRPLVDVCCSRMKHLVDDVAVFVRRRERAEDALRLDDMHIAIDSGAYATVEAAVTALLIRVKALKSPVTAFHAQQLILAELPYVCTLTPRPRPQPLLVPTLNPQPIVDARPLKLPRIADWAPTLMPALVRYYPDDGHHCIAI
ncbi:hypothetical protein ACHHYP_02767 [Achlya hypogyna]|uniref:Uncharacterized protein n=1 Tax=Achlya hypogyna TaxID=1202772 RepID=A0A1V9Z5D4_ACHHY|nr:hypothetical protein ACHHYP_02767 [Achlya hypogyna]